MPSAIIAALLLMLAGLAGWRIAADDVGPDPAKWLLHETGFWALTLLCATLAVSPLRRLMNKPQLVRWRRPLGLAGFAVVCAHLLVYATVFHGLDWLAIADDITRRTYIIVGIAAWLMLVPMAVTSSKNARRHLAERWVTIHRMIYVIVPLGVLHQGLAQKADHGQTFVFAALTVCFLIERALSRYGKTAWARQVRKQEKTNAKVG